MEPETRLRLHSRLGRRPDGRHRRRGPGKSRSARHRPDDRHVRARRHFSRPVPGRRRQNRLRSAVHAAGDDDQFGIELFERRYERSSYRYNIMVT